MSSTEPDARRDDRLDPRVVLVVAMFSAVVAALSFLGGSVASPSRASEPVATSRASAQSSATPPASGSAAAPDTSPTAPALAGKPWSQAQPLIPEGVEVTLRPIIGRAVGQTSVLSQSPRAGAALGPKLTVVIRGEEKSQVVEPTAVDLPARASATCGTKDVADAVVVSPEALAKGVKFALPELAVRVEVRLCAVTTEGAPVPRTDLAVSNEQGRTLNRRRATAAEQSLRVTVAGSRELTLRSVGAGAGGPIVLGPLTVVGLA